MQNKHKSHQGNTEPEKKQRNFYLSCSIETNADKCQQMPTNANKCQQMPTNANKCQQMPTNANKCQQMPSREISV
jgi:hypothetical protein